MCHAFVASDLITVNQRIGPRHHVSALDVASNVTVADPTQVLKKVPPPEASRNWLFSNTFPTA